MNGYASASIAGTVRGVKGLIYARAPAAVAADPAVIENAPFELTASGLGDVLAKSVSTADWRLNELLFGDYYCAYSVSLIAEIEPLYAEHPEQIKARAPKAIEALFNALLLTGVSMNMAGTSAPCSGGEHMVSHTLDMMASLDGTEHDLHGRQVGVGTILAAELYRRVLAVESPMFRAPPVEIDRPFWDRLADGVGAEYGGKSDRLRAAAQTLRQKDRWDMLRETLAPMLRTPEKLRDCLSRAGAAHKAEQIKSTRERLLQAFLHGHEIRSRVTILDLARLVGIMPAAADEIVEQWS
jgi:glycerol-1-phosphate dehydrogenase [NAD(P)+]